MVAPDNLGKSLPCQPVDLDVPVEWCAWMTIMKERIWIIRVASEIVFLLFCFPTDSDNDKNFSVNKIIVDRSCPLLMVAGGVPREAQCCCFMASSRCCTAGSLGRRQCFVGVREVFSSANSHSDKSLDFNKFNDRPLVLTK